MKQVGRPTLERTAISRLAPLTQGATAWDRGHLPGDAVQGEVKGVVRAAAMGHGLQDLMAFGGLFQGGHGKFRGGRRPSGGEELVFRHRNPILFCRQAAQCSIGYYMRWKSMD